MVITIKKEAQMASVQVAALFAACENWVLASCVSSWMNEAIEKETTSGHWKHPSLFTCKDFEKQQLTELTVS
jgi:hypothetical protein